MNQLATPGMTPVYCVINDLHRSREVADAAVQGRFTHAGLTLALSTTPDWLESGCSDDEWRIEWTKLYEGLDLADAYAATDDRRYLTAWEDLVESFCVQVPVGHDSSDVSARRVQNWLYAWQRFGESRAFPGLRPGLECRLRERILDDSAHLERNLTAARNHRTFELYTLVLVAISTDDRPRLDRSLALLAANAASDFGPDGVHCERSTDYHGIALRSLVGAILNARRIGVEPPAALVDAAGRAATVAMHWQRPDGITPAVSDGDQADFRSLLKLASRVLARGDLLWAASGGLGGTPPDADDATFANGGYAVQRSGWGTGERSFREEWWALFDVGPLGEGGHGHYDHLSVELHANGRCVVVDPGRFTYEEEPEGWRRWFKGTSAHNTVTVDGLDQTPYRRGKPKGPTSTAWLLGRETTAVLDIVVGRAVSPCYDAVHTRELRLARDDCWVVTDHLRAPTVHRYDLRWHLPPEASGATQLNVGDDWVHVETPAASLSIYSPGVAASVERGWVSPAYGVKHEAPVVVASVDSSDADMVTVVRPRSRS